MQKNKLPNGATPLDIDELKGLKAKHITTQQELNELEQANIQSGLIWLSKNRRKDILTDNFLRTLHKKLFGKVWAWAGNYRLNEKNIGIDPFYISVETYKLLDSATFWAEQTTYPPLEAAARFHHRLVQIHLFPNGNGRHARIATDLYLEKYFNHKQINWTDGFNLQIDNNRRTEYINALRKADKGDYNPLFKFIGL